MELRKLYKKTSTGKIQLWTITVKGNEIHSSSGQVNGKMIISKDIIKVGKNIGRSNETTPEQQAVLEAESKFNGKLKKGYVKDIKDAQADKVDESIIKGGYLPQLAHSFDKRGKDIVFPCAAQPKLDGIRATHTGGSKIWTRTRKEILGCPHITDSIKLISGLEFKLDGELYNHDYKDDFETIVHLVKQSKPVEGHEVVQYHVYDIPSEKPFIERLEDLALLNLTLPEDSNIKVIETMICQDKEQLVSYMEDCLERGYEGAMARNLNDNGYEYKRSKHLQKLKVFEDAEFKIIGVEEGRGKLAGHAAAFVCIKGEPTDTLLEDFNLFIKNETQPKTYKFFKAKMKGKQSILKTYWDDQGEYIDKLLTVKFQGLTNKNKVPRFPVGLRLREDM